MSFCAVPSGYLALQDDLDATVDADVVHIESVVGGRIVELAVSENAKVSKGNLLFRSDPVPYRLLSSRLKLIWGSP